MGAAGNPQDKGTPHTVVPWTHELKFVVAVYSFAMMNLMLYLALLNETSSGAIVSLIMACIVLTMGVFCLLKEVRQKSSRLIVPHVNVLIAAVLVIIFASVDQHMHGTDIVPTFGSVTDCNRYFLPCCTSYLDCSNKPQWVTVPYPNVTLPTYGRCDKLKKDNIC